jgi:hypothetical protein
MEEIIELPPFLRHENPQVRLQVTMSAQTQNTPQPNTRAWLARAIDLSNITIPNVAIGQGARAQKRSHTHIRTHTISSTTQRHS